MFMPQEICRNIAVSFVIIYITIVGFKFVNNPKDTQEMEAIKNKKSNFSLIVNGP
jgi:hypothetical protein